MKLVKRLTDKRMKGEGFICVNQKEYKSITIAEKPTAKQVYHRLLEIEDILGNTYNLDRLRELAQADREGRCVVLPDGGYEDKEGENAPKSDMHTCFYHNNPVTRFIADAVAEKLVRNETKMKHCERMAKNG